MESMNSARHVVVMGVSGSGKSTIAEGLTERTGWSFAEADEFHPQRNIDKMESGIPLTDEDRRPWLEDLVRWMRERAQVGESTIVTCSALKRSYRDLLRTAGEGVVFVHLDGDEAVLSERMRGRRGHFMPPALLRSQLGTLEPLHANEPGFTISIEESPARIVEEILRHLGR